MLTRTDLIPAVRLELELKRDKKFSWRQISLAVQQYWASLDEGEGHGGKNFMQSVVDLA